MYFQHPTDSPKHFYIIDSGTFNLHIRPEEGGAEALSRLDSPRRKRRRASMEVDGVFIGAKSIQLTTGDAFGCGEYDQNVARYARLLLPGEYAPILDWAMDDLSSCQPLTILCAVWLFTGLGLL